MLIIDVPWQHTFIQIGTPNPERAELLDHPLKSNNRQYLVSGLKRRADVPFI